MENNWIENVSGECPVEEGTLIDVQYRDGKIKHTCKALHPEADMRDTQEDFWKNDRMVNDIVKWRPHKQEQQSLDEAIGQQSYPEDFTIQQELVYPKTTFKPSSEAQLRSDEAARVNDKLHNKLVVVAFTASKLTRKNFSVADIKLVKDLLESVEEYE